MCDATNDACYTQSRVHTFYKESFCKPGFTAFFNYRCVAHLYFLIICERGNNCKRFAFKITILLQYPEQEMHYKYSNTPGMKKYRLLRNNKETGPYTAEELIRSGLKAYDLIWIDGKSAAWRYPSEMEEFKSFAPPVEEQPFDRFFKKGTAVATQTETTVTTTVTKKEKPRIRIKADSRKIETNVVIAQPAQTYNEIYSTPSSYTSNTLTQPVTSQDDEQQPSWESMWSNWEEEKKAVSKAAKSEKSNDTLETKYSQSLDDIKEQYIQTVLKQKKSDFNFEKYKNQVAVGVLIVAILGTGVWMGLNWSNRSADPNAAPLEVANVQQPQDNAQSSVADAAAENSTSLVNNENKNIEKPTSSKVTIVPVYGKSNKALQKTKAMIPAVTKEPIAKTANQVAYSKPAPKQTQQIVAEPKTTGYNPTTVLNGVRTAAKRTDAGNNLNANETVSNQNNTISEKTRQVKKEAAVGDYVSIDMYKPFANAVDVQYKISDVSDIPLDLVVIDLLYYNSYGVFLKGETMYVRDIQPGETVSVNAPDNEKASKINYKVSIVSSERNDLYLIGD